MTVEINRSVEPKLAVDVEVRSASTWAYGVIELGTYPDRVTLYLDVEVLRTLGSQILDAIEASDRPVVEETPEETPELSCDHCGRRVIVVGGYYVHPDHVGGGDPPTDGWFTCSHFAGPEYAGYTCTVNGHDRVPKVRYPRETPAKTP